MADLFIKGGVVVNTPANRGNDISYQQLTEGLNLGETLPTLPEISLDTAEFEEIIEDL
jgi:hypothetical protein